jgi:hypothetical protein
MEKKCSKAELILGYEPEPEAIFEPVGRCVDNEDGSCVIEVTIDTVYTKKIQELLPNFRESVRSIICENIEIVAEEILDKIAHKGEHTNKKARDIIMEYQHEEIPEPVFENTPPVDPLQTTKSELQSEKKKVATMELLVASLLSRVGDLEKRIA